jgi:CRP/FNR family transcriptional regulator, cyclic AMP receptor protein
MNEKIWYLKKCPVFGQLSPEQVLDIESQCFSREFNRGEMIYLPSDMGDSVLLLARGRVRIYHVTSEGKQAILGFMEPGELFGEVSVFNGSRRDEYAEATEKSFVVLLPRHVIQQLMLENPTVSMTLTRMFGLRLRRIERRLKSLLFRTSRERLIHLLLELAEKHGSHVPEGVVIGQKISHQDMASIIGATRETVTITLGELQSEGKLTIKKRQITLRNVENLAVSIDFGPVVPTFV